MHVLEEISQALKRSKSVVALIIAGIAALIALIASTINSTIALAQEVNTATLVNLLDPPGKSVFFLRKGVCSLLILWQKSDRFFPPKKII